MEQEKERREALGASKHLSAGTTTANILTIHTVKMSLPGEKTEFLAPRLENVRSSIPYKPA